MLSGFFLFSLDFRFFALGLGDGVLYDFLGWEIWVQKSVRLYRGVQGYWTFALFGRRLDWLNYIGNLFWFLFTLRIAGACYVGHAWMLWRGQETFSGLVLLFDIPWSGRVCPMLCGLCIWLCFMSIRVHLGSAAGLLVYVVGTG